MKQKPANARGTRDFLPAVVRRRQWIFDTLRAVFVRYGFEPIETPALEQLSTLTGKYGDEGDKLLFKILDSGDYLKGAPADFDFAPGNSAALTPHIAEKALRYDLTVPFARFVVQHRNDLQLPFKRYQIQPVWRADRPQRGRYREFYQCDVDVVGSPSLLLEAEFLAIYDEALSQLGLTDFTIKLNNRKVLEGLAEVLRAQNRFVELVTALDKLDKIGPDGVQRELGAAGFDAQVGEGLLAIVGFAGDTAQTLDFLDQQLTQSETGRAGVAELREVLALHAHFPQFSGRVALDLTLARGLNYYTGTIFEVKADNVQIGSIGGGGRYADLTGLFGLPNLPGVGISFGADRIYDVLDELGLFADLPTTSLRALFVNFGNEAAQHQMLRWVSAVRQAGIPADVYPDTAKLGKQFGYADQRGVPYAVVIGPDDAATDTAQLKDLRSGTQQTVSLDELLKNLG